MSSPDDQDGRFGRGRRGSGPGPRRQSAAPSEAPVAMVPMVVADVVVDPLSGQPALWLCDPAGARRVEIQLGLGEVSPIATGLGGLMLERPLAHDLLKQVLDLAELDVVQVELQKDRAAFNGSAVALPDPPWDQGDTAGCTAVIVLGARPTAPTLRPSQPNRLIRLEARAADAIALALRTDGQIYMRADELEEMMPHSLPSAPRTAPAIPVRSQVGRRRLSPQPRRPRTRA